MNNELEWEKVLEWSQHEATYLMHVAIDPQQIAIEVEDKYSGDVWHSIFSSHGIEELTTKARNPKKYAVFTKMLISALLKTSDSLGAQILSYREMNNKFGKPGTQSKAISSEQASKRFLLLTYVGEFEKMQFPLPLMYFADVSTDRLRLTIKRMAHEMHMLREEHSEDELTKQNALLKYENQSLRNKLKNSSKMDSSVLLQPKIEELAKELADKSAVVTSLEKRLGEAEKGREDSEQGLKQSEERVHKLQQELEELQSTQTDRAKSKKKLLFYEEKIEELIVQMNELSAELTYSQEKEKKSELKITTLQKQLQKMMTAKRTNPKKSVTHLRDSSPDDRKQEKSVSVRSGRSNTSQKSVNKPRNNNLNGIGNNVSRKTYNNLGQYSNISNLNNSKSKRQQLSGRKSSVYDSDTESSRMRKLTSGSSPYRQTKNVSGNRPVQRPANQRSRSKSRERVTSPKASFQADSQVMTEGYQSGSSDNQFDDRINVYLKNLKSKKGTRNVMAKPGTSSNSKNKNSESNLQGRLQTLEQMIKKTASSTRNRQ